MRERLATFRQAQSDVENRLELSHREHTAIVGAILAGNAESAFNAMREHDARLSTNVIRIIRNHSRSVVA